MAITAATNPPVARHGARVDELHGEIRRDPYHWMRDKTNPEVVAVLEAENAYAHAVLAPIDGLRETLYREMLGRIKQTDLSVPYRDRGYFYYQRTVEGLQYPIYCRKAGALDAEEQVLLDGNELAAGHPFFALGTVAVSDDGNVLAFTTDVTGFRQFTLRVKDLTTGAVWPDPRHNVTSVAWAADGRTLFYTVEDDTKRSYRLYRSEPAARVDDVLVYEEPDERFSCSVERSRSGRMLFFNVGSHTTSEVRLLRADRPLDPWRLVAPREHDIEYDVEHGEGLLYIRVNDTGRHFRLVEAPEDRPERERWREIVPHRPDVMLEGVLAFRRHLVLCERRNALTELTIWDPASGHRLGLSFPEPVYSAGPSTNREYDTDLFRYEYQSFITPRSIFDVDVRTGRAELLKQTEVLGGYDPDLYRSERVWVTASDGVQVPVSVLCRRDVPRDGTAAMLLVGYGAYGIPMPVTFSSNVLSLVDRGVVYAIAHVRGGGDLGKTWHDAGRMLRKRTSFTDFIAAADHLVENGYAARERLAIAGGSAGGLLIGAALNLRRDLCRAVVLWVPFLDVINTMLDPSLPLTVGEYEEWGNPAVADEYRYIASYCPYSNLQKGDYPAMLVRTSLNDSQVMYWEPAKYVARLRTLKTDARPLLLLTNMAAGHGGASGRYDRLQETALDYAFVLWQVGAVTPLRQDEAGRSRPT